MLGAAVDTMTTAEGNAPGKAQDLRVAWASMILEQTFSRYNDIQCIDETRVILREHSSDYIHANWMTTPKGKKFICTQGPMPNTISDFWRMILQEDCRTIIMLCCLKEDKKQKCAKYYPSKASKPFLIDNTVVQLIKRNWSEDLGIMTSVWNVKHREREFELRHIQYKKWPDHSVPKDSLGVLELHKIMEENSDDHPVVIHCSAGIGRTCTLTGIEMLLEQLRTLNFQSSTTIVKSMRRARLGAVQKAIQYLFMHVAVLEWLCQVLDPESILNINERHHRPAAITGADQVQKRKSDDNTVASKLHVG
ncbi:Protein-tyrosine phosphatase [Ancylostoma caninum]|uniref:Protein-tyrosine phosphatase n=1 Tax=Ancylostoma caninum TaxID=29170 RepID=A0A368GHB6_ANCCA|nr:Protein-tyrosine phosphatase [Ancylostoma caninum]